MRSRSSIFSSDTLEAAIWPTRAVLCAIILCIGFRVVLGLVGPSFTGVLGYWLVDTDLGWAQKQMDRSVVAGAEKPRCLVFGSSRVGLAIEARTLAESLDWQVIKTPVNAGTPWAFLQLFEAEPELLDDVAAVVVDAQYFQFNDNSPGREGNRFVRLTDTFDPLWSDIQTAKGISSGWREYLWPVVRERRTLMEVAKGGALFATDGRPYRPMHERWGRYEANPARIYDPRMAPEATARRAMIDFEFSEFMVETWRELAALCRERGVPLVIIYPPVKAAYVSALTSRDDWAANRQQVQEAVKSLDELPGTWVIFTESLADIGLDEDDSLFMDYGHMARVGAKKYSAWLGSEIRARLAVSVPTDDS